MMVPTNNDFQKHEIQQKLEAALISLGASTSSEAIADISTLIFEGMTGAWRFYHTPEHILEMAQSDDPIITLAALFHDLVYVQIDGSIYFNLVPYLALLIKQDGDHLILCDRTHQSPDPYLEIVLAIFGLQASQPILPTKGQNEFLSAVIAAKILEPILPLRTIAQIVTCIEATVPFRASFHDLYQRFAAVNESFALGFSASEVTQTLEKAVLLSNLDLLGFASESSSYFLANTWQLLPEMNKPLGREVAYTIKDYRKALHGQDKFFDFLKPELIFHQFNQVPDAKTYAHQLAMADQNIQVARLYLKAKLVTVAILEALMSQYSLEPQMAIIMGDLPKAGFATVRITDFLPELNQPVEPQTRLEAIALDILKVGRLRETTYDLSNSPLSSFVVECIGFAGVLDCSQNAQPFFEQTLTPEDFLRRANPDLVTDIKDALVAFMQHRIDAVAQWSGAILMASRAAGQDSTPIAL
jgi:hypothetical protein